MAGNTKLLGFGVENSVTLERWGEQEQVEISQDSWKALQSACASGLPRKPPAQKNWKDDFNASYDEDVGRVRVDLDVQTAGEIADALSFFRDEEVETKLTPWIRSLRKAVQAHKDYHDLSEPGVE